MFMYTDYNQHLLDNVKKIHFIGCGGSGMYPLIQILAAKGYEISGSDVLDGSIIRYEREMGVKYADYFDVSMDYLYCRTDEPRGKLYDYKPQALKEKMEQSEEMREFIEMCFDPQAPVNKRLKEALLRIMTEEANEE